MSLKSVWAYRNGERMIREVNDSLTSEKTGWIERGNLLVYAERYNKKLMVKTYSNKTQCNKKIIKLKENGFDCFISKNHPFTINMKSKNKTKTTKKINN